MSHVFRPTRVCGFHFKINHIILFCIYFVCHVNVEQIDTDRQTEKSELHTYKHFWTVLLSLLYRCFSLFYICFVCHVNVEQMDTDRQTDISDRDCSIYDVNVEQTRTDREDRFTHVSAFLDSTALPVV